MLFCSGIPEKEFHDAAEEVQLLLNEPSQFYNDLLKSEEWIEALSLKFRTETNAAIQAKENIDKTFRKLTIEVFESLKN